MADDQRSERPSIILRYTELTGICASWLMSRIYIYALDIVVLISLTSNIDGELYWETRDTSDEQVQY